MAIRNLDLILEDFEPFLEKHIQGGTTEYPMEPEWVEEQGIMTAEEYNFHEEELCFFFDNRWFQCSQCGWTLPIEDMANEDEWECTDCSLDPEDYEEAIDLLRKACFGE